MKAIRTKNGGYGLFFNEPEMLTLGFISVNLLGKTGIEFLDEYSNKTVPSLLSSQQLLLLEELYNQIKGIRL